MNIVTKPKRGMKILIITGDRLNGASTPDRERWTAAITGVIEQTFDGDRLNAAVVAGSNDGIDAIAIEMAMNVPMLVGRVTNDRLIFNARQFRSIGAEVSFAVFHDNIHFSRSSRQILDEARTHGFPAIVVSSRGFVDRRAA
jgi:hypothetical protein